MEADGQSCRPSGRRRLRPLQVRSAGENKLLPINLVFSPQHHETTDPPLNINTTRNFRGAQYTEFAHPPEPTPKRCLAQGVGTLSQLPSNPKLLFFLENLGPKHYQPLAHHTEVFTQRSWLYFNPGIITLLPTTVISCKASHYSSLLTPFPAAPATSKRKQLFSSRVLAICQFWSI